MKISMSDGEKGQKTSLKAGIAHKILKITESLLKKLVKFILTGPPNGKKHRAAP